MYIWVFFRKFMCCFGFLRNRSVCFGCFDIGSKHRNKPKICCFWFHETNRNTTETDLVSVCFGSNRNLFLFVSRTPYRQHNWDASKNRDACTSSEAGNSMQCREADYSHSWTLADLSVIGACVLSNDDSGKNDGLKSRMAESVR